MSDDDDIILAVAMLQRGGVVAFPTETVYGLGADALNTAAVERVFSIKGRPAQHPLIVHIADASQLSEWARDIPAMAYTLATRFWPGPLTLILKRAARVPDNVTGGQDTIGLRVPNHLVALSLLKKFGGGIAAPSANRFGRISPTTQGHVRAEFGNSVDMILDGGPCQVGVESTIVSLVGERPVILRPGGISRVALAGALGVSVEFNSAADNSPRAPGMLERHYAPRTPLRIVPTGRLFNEVSAMITFGQRVGILELAREPSKLPFLERGVFRYSMPVTPVEYAQSLYATLRQADDAQLDYLLVEQMPDSEEWLTVNDRLRRAANAHSE
ncbi:MAG: L-threonylcarbamoyladenylate synthase [Gammaproteobacteria bacterium]